MVLFRRKPLIDGNRTKSCIAILALLVGMAPPSLASSVCGDDQSRSDERTLPGESVSGPGNGWTRRELPSKGDVDVALTELDEQVLPAAYAVDLNTDRRAELLLTSSDGRLCGNAGCPYVLLAAKSMKRIYTFFGHLAILDERVTSYCVIQSYSRYRADMSSLDTYVFDRGRYRLVSHVLVDSCGLEQWLTHMRPQGNRQAISNSELGNGDHARP